MATRARALDRMAPDIPLTLNGLDYMTASTHYETVQIENTGEVIDLSIDHELIRWMQENVQGSPVIMEGRSYPSEYHWNGRFAITTGLPSVLGWNFHQKQQQFRNNLLRASKPLHLTLKPIKRKLIQSLVTSLYKSLYLHQHL